VTCSNGEVPDPTNACACACKAQCGPKQTLDSTACKCNCDPTLTTCAAGFNLQVDPTNAQGCVCACGNICGNGCGMVSVRVPYEITRNGVRDDRSVRRSSAPWAAAIRAAPTASTSRCRATTVIHAR
jgi:hypothetical protein